MKSQTLYSMQNKKSTTNLISANAVMSILGVQTGWLIRKYQY